MNKGIVEMNLLQFSLIYLLLILVLVIMKKRNIDRTKLLIVASIRMTLQLVIAGFVLTYIIQNPHPLFTLAYLTAMIGFAIYRVLKLNPGLPSGFQRAIALAMSLSGLFIIFYFVTLVIGESPFNPQYVIPLSGMIMGNAMTGTSLGIKSFRESFQGQKPQVDALLNFGVKPDRILLPFVNQAIESALLPTMNSMLGTGIVALPGMMSGQILSGVIPTTAILYQIAIMVALSTVVCLSSFGSLYFGYKSLYNDRNQINLLMEEEKGQKMGKN